MPSINMAMKVLTQLEVVLLEQVKIKNKDRTITKTHSTTKTFTPTNSGRTADPSTKISRKMLQSQTLG